MSSSSNAAVDIDAAFESRLNAGLLTVQAWDDDPLLLAECRAHIPYQELMDDTSSSYVRDDDHLYQGDALFLKRLTVFFQTTMMTWINQPACKTCGSTEQMEYRETRGPETEEEKEGMAKRVEVYSCSSCNNGTITSFPRYNSPRKLLETRQGRCGEYANLMGLFCRAAGFETRYVLDMTDHVWVEVLVPDHGDDQWIMADGCEGLIEKNSMYEHGWGKSLNYIVAISTDNITDVTPKYTRQFNSDKFQSGRRKICTSEASGNGIIQKLRQRLQQQSGLSKSRMDELARRNKQEDQLLNRWKICTEWTEHEKHGRGRISGSIEWKTSRQEQGKNQQQQDDKPQPSIIRSFHVEHFYPNTNTVTIKVTKNSVVVSGARCGLDGDMSVVVVDEIYLGCILQCRSFSSLNDLQGFIKTLPDGRIVALRGKGLAEASLEPQLSGFRAPSSNDDEVLYIGQVATVAAATTKIASPEWTVCTTDSEGAIVELDSNLVDRKSCKLRTEKGTVPARVACRLAESAMPLQTQLMASEAQKRAAFLNFIRENKTNHVGYTTKVNCPVYLLDAQSFPFQPASNNSSTWNTFHFLPEPLVPKDDNGIEEVRIGPQFDIPLDQNFFNALLGPNLLTNMGLATLDTHSALYNARLIGLYFSAHWCGPCRSFTPLLAEAYSHLKEEYPAHGLEIVFISSDRDPMSFEQYYRTMPWLSIPFQQRMLKQEISVRYGVRGIPSLVVLDAMSGQIVVSADVSRRDVMQASQQGDEGIEQLLKTWLDRIPEESREITKMLELSCVEEDKPVLDNPWVDFATRREHPYCIRDGGEAKMTTARAGEIKKKEKPDTVVKNGSKTVFQTETDMPKQSIGDIVQDIKRRNSGNSGAIESVISTIIKYVENAAQTPSNPKFRGFKLSNKIVDRITRIDGGLQLVCSFGLEVVPASNDFTLRIPLALHDLDGILSRMRDFVRQM